MDDMRIILANHDDEKNALETFMEKRGHTALFLSNFYCESNGIERVWGLSERNVRANCDYTFDSLRKNVPMALDSISPLTIANYYTQRSRHYMFAY